MVLAVDGDKVANWGGGRVLVTCTGDWGLVKKRNPPFGNCLKVWISRANG